MAALREIKTRIASINNTLKITSAMKMVASAKLHKVQSVAAALAEYEHRLSEIASALCSDPEIALTSSLVVPHEKKQHAVVIAFSSDTSLCGNYNANAIRTLRRQMGILRKKGFGRITVYPIGEKIAQAANKAGYKVNTDFKELAGKASYDIMSQLADRLMNEYTAGSVDEVYLVYNHFHSMGKQEPQADLLLPLTFADIGIEGATDIQSDYIYEPAAAELLNELLPYTLRTQLYEVLLDSSTAEHAARMVAMQTATDNARELLDDLSLTYNKQRQQAITEELADTAQPN
ncbi:ATP synthase F1 subunit gamma [uncultured Alistipes sp.]|jgi:ATP synthase F1, gamma subunit|uniref:ATP synthase F1 subunit gamma n=1 Tax=uncultured Alistipes sp. TaxID=538949 RepID=UPI0026015ABE|nr:ATP synthase F1 subunit gamma [uncultured Alistipes sp.]